MFKFYKLEDINTVTQIINVMPSIKFSSVSHFNDPFELKFNLKIDVKSKVSREKYFEKFPEKSIKEYRDWQNGVNRQFLWHTEQGFRQDIYNIYKLSCFCQDNQSSLMWAHYADNHRGICIEYKKQEIIDYLLKTPGFLASGNVQYSKKPPLLNVFETDELKIAKLFFHKQKEWQYEKEFRIVLRSKDLTEYVKISPEFISAIYIGSRCNQEIEKKVIDLCDQQSISVFQAISFGDTYDMQFEKVQKNCRHIKSFW